MRPSSWPPLLTARNAPLTPCFQLEGGGGTSTEPLPSPKPHPSQWPSARSGSGEEQGKVKAISPRYCQNCWGGGRVMMGASPLPCCLTQLASMTFLPTFLSYAFPPFLPQLRVCAGGLGREAMLAKRTMQCGRGEASVA